jgi:hypothetical protein
MQNNSSNLNSSGNSSAQKQTGNNLSFDQVFGNSGRVIKNRPTHHRENYHQSANSYCMQQDSGSASSKSSRSANSKKGSRDYSRSRLPGVGELTYNLLPVSQVATVDDYTTIRDNRQQVKTAFNSTLSTCEVAFKVENVKP